MTTFNTTPPDDGGRVVKVPRPETSQGMPNDKHIEFSVAQAKLNELQAHQNSPHNPITKSEDLTRDAIAIEQVEGPAKLPKAVEEKHGNLWKCQEQIAVSDVSGGFVYRYRLEDSYNYFAHLDDLSGCDRAADAANLKRSPATEAGLMELLAPEDIPLADYESLKRRADNGEIVELPIYSNWFSPIAKELGYKLVLTKDGVYLEMPDKKVLTKRWKIIRERENALRKGNPDAAQLPKLRIQSSEGIADDADFTRAITKEGYNAVLSDGEEFVHDQLIHVLRTVNYMYESPGSYTTLRAKGIQAIESAEVNIEAMRRLVKEQPELLTSIYTKQQIVHLKRNLARGDVILGVLTDSLTAAQANSPQGYWLLNGIKGFEEVAKYVGDYEPYLTERFKREISERYKEKNGVEIPPEELAARMEGISLPWLCGEMKKRLADPKLKETFTELREEVLAEMEDEEES